MPAYEIDEPALLEKLGKAIRCIRKEKKISQEKLALNAGLSREYIGRLERNSVNASYITLCRICAVLGVKLSDILIRAKL